LPGVESKFELLGPNGRVVAVAGDLIGTGRVAAVFEVADPPGARSLVLKLFSERPVPDEVKTMIELAEERGLDEVAPFGLDEEAAFPMIAAPKCMVFAVGGEQPIGLASLRVDGERFRPLNEILNGSRVKRDLLYGTTIALRLADLVNEVHSRNFVIGDISGTNLMADREGFCTIVDVDSFGVVDDDGGSLIEAAFATSNYIAPDLEEGHATQDSDCFIIACLILQFLCRGMHPFGGVHQESERSTIQENMDAQASWLFAREEFTLPPPFGQFMSIECLPPSVRRLATDALMRRDRPTAQQWMDVLASLIEKVEFCENCGEQKFVRASCWSCGSEGSGTVYQPSHGDAAGASALDAEGEEHGARLTGLWAKWRSRRTDAN
jgi:DNA-binding helix-hairpin-helix protein with protein kinase domain